MVTGDVNIGQNHILSLFSVIYKPISVILTLIIYFIGVQQKMFQRIMIGLGLVYDHNAHLYTMEVCVLTTFDLMAHFL